MAPTSLYKHNYPHHPTYDAFPEGFVFECPYHPGGPLSVTTHRGYLGALRATVHCTHNGCHFSAYDDGSVSSASQCPTARAERDRDGPGDLKPGTHIPFHCLIYRRRWAPHQADSGGRVIIQADVDPVMERCPGAPVPPSKTPSVLQSPAATVASATPNKDTSESSIPSSTEDRGSSCFGNSINIGCPWMKANRSTEEGKGLGSRGRKPSNTPPLNVSAFIENFGKELPGKEHFLKQTVRPIPPPPRAKPPPRNTFEIVDLPQKSSDDDYFNVSRSPENDSVTSRWQTLRNIHYRDDVYNNGHISAPTSESVTSCSTENSDNASYQDKRYPEFYPGTFPKATQLRDVKHQASSTDACKSDTRDGILTLRFNTERGAYWGPRAEEKTPASGGIADELSADLIANLVLRLASIPERLNSLEKVNQVAAKSNDAKDAKIKRLEESIERFNLREKELEDIIATYEQIGRRHQFSSLA